MDSVSMGQVLLQQEFFGLVKEIFLLTPSEKQLLSNNPFHSFEELYQ